MVDRDFHEFELMWGHIAEIYGKPIPSEIPLKIIFGSLMSFTMEQVRRGASFYIRTGKFMPRPADIAEIIVGTANERARAAFMVAASAAERIGSWKTVQFGDDNIMTVIYALGGWSEFCHFLKNNRPQIEARFVKWHEAAQTMTKKTFPPVLRGADNLCKTVEVVKCDDNVCGMLQLSSGN